MRRPRQHTTRRSEPLETCRRQDYLPTTTRQSKRSKQDWTKQRRPITNPWPSARGSEQARTRSLCMREDLKAVNDRVQETEQSIVVAQQSLEQHRAKVVEIEKSLQERRNHLEQLHRQAAAEASHGAVATQLQILVPDGVTKHLPQEASDCLRKAADLHEEERKAEAAATEQPHVRRKKRWSLTSLEISTIGRTPCLTPLPRHESRRALTRYCKLKPEATQRDWQSCGRKWPEISARRRRMDGAGGATTPGAGAGAPP